MKWFKSLINKHMFFHSCTPYISGIHALKKSSTFFQWNYLNWLGSELKSLLFEFSKLQ